MSVQSDLSQFTMSESDDTTDDLPEVAPQSNDRAPCGVETTKGTPCLNPEIVGLGVCRQHIGAIEDGDDESETPVWERQKDDLLGEGSA